MARHLLLVILAFLTLGGAVMASAGTVSAEGSIRYEIDISNLPNKGPNRANDTRIQRVLNVTFGIIGAVSLLMVTIGGFRYISAQGETNQIAEAKRTIIYALVGLVVSLLAIVIVTFVVGRVTSGA